MANEVLFVANSGVSSQTITCWPL